MKALAGKDITVNKVLMLARSFPPFRTVGGSIRIVKFIKYLPDLGWQPSILTIDDQKEYETTYRMGSESLFSEIPSDVSVYRTPAAEPSMEYLEKEDAFRRQNWLSAALVKLWGGSRRWILRNLFLPDRYLAWLPVALKRGRGIVEKEKIDVIFATCPPHSNAIIGAYLKHLTNKPLILDFRDDWIDTPWYHWKPVIKQRIEKRLEKWAVKSADRVVLVTEWSKKAFLERYPKEPKEKFVFISNGCDLEEFANLEQAPLEVDGSQFVILHAGRLNDAETWNRSPEAFFRAVSNLQKMRPELSKNLKVVFTGYLPEGHKRLITDIGLNGVVEEVGHLKRDKFLRLMKSSHLLLAINYEDFATLIPGKIYEYWAVGGPPILLLSCSGAAQVLIEKNNLGFTASHDDVQAIEDAIWLVYRSHQTSNPIRINTAGIEKYDREALSAKLAQTLSEVLT
jgi:glycosyltransferase involved in cell wall biosynthesis